METFLNCQISPGLFDGEVAVRGATADGREFSLFVPDDFVECEGSVADGGHADGWLRVQVLATQGPLTLVRLPGQAFERGQTITVRDSQIQERSPRAKV